MIFRTRVLEHMVTNVLLVLLCTYLYSWGNRYVLFIQTTRHLPFSVSRQGTSTSYLPCAGVGDVETSDLAGWLLHQLQSPCEVQITPGIWQDRQWDSDTENYLRLISRLPYSCEPLGNVYKILCTHLQNYTTGASPEDIRFVTEYQLRYSGYAGRHLFTNLFVVFSFSCSVCVRGSCLS